VTTINELSRSETVADADLIPMWNTSEGDTRAFPASALKDSTQVGVLRNDLASQLVTGGPALLGYDGSLNYAAGTLGGHAVGDAVDPHDYPWLAKGDGTTDDAPAINAALAFAASSGRDVVRLRGKTYRCASPLLLNAQGLQLRGVSEVQTTLLIDQTTGPGVSISQPYCQLADMTVSASTTRANYTTGSTYALAAGLFGVQIYNAAGFLTATRVERVWSISHPNNGFYMGGEGAGSMFVGCAALSNRGHGFYFDNRALLGGTSSRCGIVSMIHCRGLDNGGNALFNDATAGPCYRFWVHNFETIWNAWNTSIAGLQNAEFHIGGENHVINQSAQADLNGDTRTTTDQGRPRLVKSPALSVGIYIGSNSSSITLVENRFISTSRGVQTAATVSTLHLRVRNAYFTQQQKATPANQFFGFDIGTGYQCLQLDVQTAQPVDFMVRSPTTSGTCRVGDVENLVYGNSTGGLFRRTPGYVNATIASSSVNAQSVNVNLQTGAATNLVAIVFAGGANPLPPGETLHFFNGSAFTVTLKHGTLAGYIRTKSGTDVTVPAGGRFSIVTDASGNPWEL